MSFLFWNFNEYLLKFFSSKCPLKLNLLFVEISTNIYLKFGTGLKIDEKVSEILLKYNFTDHSLKVQWLFVKIFSLTFKWYTTFTPVHQLYITEISTQFSNSAFRTILQKRKTLGILYQTTKRKKIFLSNLIPFHSVLSKSWNGQFRDSRNSTEGALFSAE